MNRIPGQEIVDLTLRHDVQQQSISHCYLFTGPSGTGKTQTALAFAQWLNCLSPLPEGACGICRSCLKSAQFSHPDLLFYFPESTHTDRFEILSERIANPFSNLIPDFNANYKIAQIKEIIHQINMGLHEGQFKIVILAQAERMNRESANALLKSLEEPPSRTVFILTSDEPLKLLPTIKSRSRIIQFHPLNPQQITDYIHHQTIPIPISLPLMVELTRGSIGRIDRLRQFDLVQLERFCRQIIQSYSTPRYTQAVILADQFLKLSDEEKEIVIDMLMFYISRNLHRQLLPPDEKQELFSFPLVLNDDEVSEKLLFILDRMKYLIRRNFNLSLIFTTILINIDKLDDIQRLVTESSGSGSTF
ncbi:MAG: DNA polymerase III subunit delta' [Candidatus Delongbacteria bacterium]|nr:DNA polymerase III subunit delta' [Candidatus Delongbacteria bacterium]